MQTEFAPPIYALTKEHDTIVLAIYTGASVSLSPIILEKEGAVDLKVQTVKALWDTGATHTAISNQTYFIRVRTTSSTGTICILK